MSNRVPFPKAAALCALAYVVAFLALASALRHSFGFPLDDSCIHQVVARNLSTSGVLGFTPGQTSSGSTSLLWTLILTDRSWFLSGVSPVMYSAAMSVVLMAATGYVLKRLTEKDGLAPAASWCLALTPAASGNFLWLGMIGMEHLLFILWSLLLISLCLTARIRVVRPGIELRLRCFASSWC